MIAALRWVVVAYCFLAYPITQEWWFVLDEISGGESNRRLVELRAIIREILRYQNCHRYVSTRTGPDPFRTITLLNSLKIICKPTKYCVVYPLWATCRTLIIVLLAFLPQATNITISSSLTVVVIILLEDVTCISSPCTSSAPISDSY